MKNFGPLPNVALLLLPTVVLFGSGCAIVGPDYQAPVPKTPDAWSLAIKADFDSRDPTLQAWWNVFNDKPLNQLIDRVKNGNLNLKVAAARVAEARAQLGYVRGARLPALDATGSAARIRSSEETVPLIPQSLDREDSLYQAGAVVNWELDVWGRIARSIESAEANYQSSVESYRDVLVLLHAEVATAYFDVRSLQERIGYANANAKAQKATLKLTEDRYKAELVPELDVKQAELNLATTVASIPPLRLKLVQSMNRLGILSGQSPTALHKLLKKPRKVPTLPKQYAVGQPVNLLRQRPDIRRAERLLASQHAKIGVATGDLYPQFTLPGSFVFEATDAGDVFNGGSLGYSFGPSVRWNLFSGGRIRSSIRVEEARTKQALHDYENTVLKALEEVENAMVSIKEERARNTALTDAVEAADASTKLVDTLYRAGLTNFQNVLDMQRTLTAQQDALAESNGNLGRNATLLYKALGGGWDPGATTTPSSKK